REEIARIEPREHVRLETRARAERQIHRALPCRVRPAARGLQQMTLADAARSPEPERPPGAVARERAHVRDGRGIAAGDEGAEYRVVVETQRQRELSRSSRRRPAGFRLAHGSPAMHGGSSAART